MITSDELRRVLPALAELPPATLEEVARAAIERRYGAKRVLYRSGDAADGLYIVLSGKVLVVRETSRDTQMLHTETTGGVLGEIPIFGGGAFPATATAVEPTRCAHLPIGVVERLLRGEPEFARFALKRLAARAQSLLRRIDELTASTITSRLAQVIMERAAAARGSDFTLGMSQEALAMELGTAREVVVRALGALVEAKAIERTGRSRFRVRQARTLQSIASHSPTA
jgi:CRP/FNR family transcriptional regulator, dissimilatory nitrate respiration regulator